MRAIGLKELQGAINRILDDLVARGVESIPIEHGYYWNVLDDKFVMDSVPTDLGVGDLNADLDYVRSSLESEDAPPALLLVGLASLLSYVGERAGDQLYQGQAN